jgi:hypothetical protein
MAKDKDTQDEPLKPLPDDRAPMIRRRVLERDQRELKVPLTPEELRAASRRIGALMRQSGQLEAVFDELKQKHKADLAELETEIARLGVILDTEVEDRLVECVTEVNWDAGTAETIRTDTHETIFTRQLTPQERQNEMFREEHVGRKPRGKRASDGAGE